MSSSSVAVEMYRQRLSEKLYGCAPSAGGGDGALSTGNNDSPAGSAFGSFDDHASSPMMLGSSPFSVMMSSEDDESSCSSTNSAHMASSADSTNGNGGLLTVTALTAGDVAGAKRRRKKKKRLVESMSTTSFKDIYYLTGDVLGEGSYGKVETCINMFTDTEYAVKIISKNNWCFSRSKVLKEVELYYLCQGQREIIQLVEYFEESDFFYLIFEKAYGGPLLSQIQRRVRFTEEEAVSIIRDLALALRFLHERGIAHRDLKPENILCVNANSPLPIKLCDFDLCSSVNQTLSTPLLQSPVGSAEYMAPEVVNAFSCLDYDYDEDDDELTYDKRCDLWSLGVIAYILLCGYLPFSGHCDKDCGWDRGEECLQCQRSLFDAIKSGSLVFPEQHWSSISPEAKDLISRLLVKEASQRLDTHAVLSHPWIVQGGSAKKSLETPAVLRRQTCSVKEISELANSVLAFKRTFAAKPSFSRAMLGGRAMHKSATASDFTAPEMLLQQQQQPMQMQQHRPLRKTSAQVNNFVDHQTRMMRRQTSLIFPEETTSLFNRCEF